MRAAAIDIGTNTTLLLVAERGPRGDVRAVHEAAEITRLGEGVDRTRRLAPEAVERTSACLARYAALSRELGAERVAVVGTSAMRDAGGGDVVRARVRELFGVEARTISGDEEARLTFRGATSGLALPERDRVVVFDIGGGSTEIVAGTLGGDIDYARSFDVGSVRLTERHVRADPPTTAELDAIEAAAGTALAALPRLELGASPPIGIAGTMTSLAAVALGLDPYDGARVHGHVMDVAELGAVVRRLAAEPLDARKRTRGLEPKRADVIVAGGIVALAVLGTLGAAKVRISDRGVRWGLVEELLAQ
jgi:exopolyphosphatase/guanosine-5'-triphosphate,3'-diphosphate pyrophosphatase